jgi:osmotically-inducible protein OsmY
MNRESSDRSLAASAAAEPPGEAPTIRHQLSISLEAGSVVLRGAVETAAAARAAETLAKKISQNGKVVDLLSIGEPQDQDAVYQSGVESFPASDPPSWNPGQAAGGKL